ncbi:hypothetical protein KSF_080990 [Reticulibacter mediterranei]|uniref:Uncharacterized protein n=1 Tax=Reticulibacter mediterranei TaxID=2778369 RepID=A0A8J3INX7_9CHLR|nr:hypothetical protein KSF_080990 [Reticulibacter mediterranei]
MHTCTPFRMVVVDRIERERFSQIVVQNRTPPGGLNVYVTVCSRCYNECTREMGQIQVRNFI